VTRYVRSHDFLEINQLKPEATVLSDVCWAMNYEGSGKCILVYISYIFPCRVCVCVQESLSSKKREEVPHKNHGILVYVGFCGG